MSEGVPSSGNKVVELSSEEWLFTHLFMSLSEGLSLLEQLLAVVIINFLLFRFHLIGVLGVNLAKWIESYLFMLIIINPTKNYKVHF